MGIFVFYQLWSRVWKLLSFSNFSYKQKWNVGLCQQLSFDQPLEWTKFLWTNCTYRICNQKRVSSSRSWEKREKHVFNVMMGQCTMKELYFLDHKGHVDCWNFDGSIQYNQRPEIIVSRLSLSPYQCIYMLCGRTVCLICGNGVLENETDIQMNLLWFSMQVAHRIIHPLRYSGKILEKI